jgi:hypothetical protein
MWAAGPLTQAFLMMVIMWQHFGFERPRNQLCVAVKVKDCRHD